VYLTKGTPRALIDAFSAHNKDGDERSTSPRSFEKGIIWLYLYCCKSATATMEIVKMNW